MSAPIPNYANKATLDRVVDGDTYWLRLDKGTYAGIRDELVVDVRLEGIDIVERNDVLGPAARRAAEAFLTEAGRIIVQTVKPDLTGPIGATFQRTRGHVWVDGRDMAELMRQAGFEKPKP